METKCYNIWCKHSSYYWAYTKSCCFHTIKLVYIKQAKIKVTKIYQRVIFKFGREKELHKIVSPPAIFCMFARSRREEIFQIVLLSVLCIMTCPCQVHKNWYFIDSLNFLVSLKSIFLYLVRFSIIVKFIDVVFWSSLVSRGRIHGRLRNQTFCKQYHFSYSVS